MNIDMKAWPVLIISSQFDAPNDEGLRLRALMGHLQEEKGLSVQPSFSYEDGFEVFMSQSDLGAILIDWDMNCEQGSTEKMMPEELLVRLRERNAQIPIILLTERLASKTIPTHVLELINDTFWKTSDTTDFLAGRTEVFLSHYVNSVYPPFFGELVKYAQEYKYAWHTPGHMGGQGFLRSPPGVAMYNFFGENIFRADLSISVPELGSLLDHSGVVGEAEHNAAKVFGADITFFVLNGTSNVNQIIWRSQLVCDDIAFVDRNCHKSLNYAMVVTDAYPVYMVPRRNKRGTIGPCRLSEFSESQIRQKIQDNALIPDKAKQQTVKMSALTNSTYDGICYNVVEIKRQLRKSVENLHFDEAWYAYARFHPIYKDHYGMADEDRSEEFPPIFCSHSTHKLLTAFSQASMLHVRQGSHTEIDPAELNESYMMYGSTSPQYNMSASLDVATKTREDDGFTLMNDVILDAVRLRQKVALIAREKKQKDSWFFEMWQPQIINYQGTETAFENVPEEYLASTQSVWVFDKKHNWHGFPDIEDNYVMLDPTKLTFKTPGLDDDGNMQEIGIPAVVVTNYLIQHGIVCEKTDYYSFLLLNSVGTTKAKQCSLLTALLRFKDVYDKNLTMNEVFPDLVHDYPDEYADVGVRDHCQAIHDYFRKHQILDKMQSAFQVIPDQAMKPSGAYYHVVRKEVEKVRFNDILGRTPAVMIVPYPPGIPIMMGGEMFNEKARPIYEYLVARQDFESLFPGYESDIHGVERIWDNECGEAFEVMCVKQ